MATNIVPNNTLCLVIDGTPTDATFTTPPSDGQLVIDYIGKKLWVRAAGAWIGVTVA